MIKSFTISKFATSDSAGAPNGMMMPIWKDYDPIPKMAPRFIYFVTCAGGSSKGPYLHKKRRGLLTLMEGKIILVWKSSIGFHELPAEATSKEGVMFDIPPGVGYLIKNPFSAEAKMLNICDYPWIRGEDETLTPDFSDYSSEKK